MVVGSLPSLLRAASGDQLDASYESDEENDAALATTSKHDKKSYASPQDERVPAVDLEVIWLRVWTAQVTAIQNLTAYLNGDATKATVVKQQLGDAHHSLELFEDIHNSIVALNLITEPKLHSPNHSSLLLYAFRLMGHLIVDYVVMAHKDHVDHMMELNLMKTMQRRLQGDNMGNPFIDIYSCLETIRTLKLSQRELRISLTILSYMDDILVQMRTNATQCYSILGAIEFVQTLLLSAPSAVTVEDLSLPSVATAVDKWKQQLTETCWSSVVPGAIKQRFLLGIGNAISDVHYHGNIMSASGRLDHRESFMHCPLSPEWIPTDVPQTVESIAFSAQVIRTLRSKRYLDDLLQVEASWLAILLGDNPTTRDQCDKATWLMRLRALNQLLCNVVTMLLSEERPTGLAMPPLTVTGARITWLTLREEVQKCLRREPTQLDEEVERSFVANIPDATNNTGMDWHQKLVQIRENATAKRHGDILSSYTKALGSANHCHGDDGLAINAKLYHGVFWQNSVSGNDTFMLLSDTGQLTPYDGAFVLNNLMNREGIFSPISLPCGPTGEGILKLNFNTHCMINSDTPMLVWKITLPILSESKYWMKVHVRLQYDPTCHDESLVLMTTVSQGSNKADMNNEICIEQHTQVYQKALRSDDHIWQVEFQLLARDCLLGVTVRPPTSVSKTPYQLFLGQNGSLGILRRVDVLGEKVLLGPLVALGSPRSESTMISIAWTPKSRYHEVYDVAYMSIPQCLQTYLYNESPQDIGSIIPNWHNECVSTMLDMLTRSLLNPRTANQCGLLVTMDHSAASLVQLLYPLLPPDYLERLFACQYIVGTLVTQLAMLSEAKTTLNRYLRSRAYPTKQSSDLEIMTALELISVLNGTTTMMSDHLNLIGFKLGPLVLKYSTGELETVSDYVSALRDEIDTLECILSPYLWGNSGMFHGLMSLLDEIINEANMLQQYIRRPSEERRRCKSGRAELISTPIAQTGLHDSARPNDSYWSDIHVTILQKDSQFKQLRLEIYKKMISHRRGCKEVQVDLLESVITIF